MTKETTHRSRTSDKYKIKSRTIRQEYGSPSARSFKTKESQEFVVDYGVAQNIRMKLPSSWTGWEVKVMDVYIVDKGGEGGRTHDYAHAWIHGLSLETKSPSHTSKAGSEHVHRSVSRHSGGGLEGVQIGRVNT